MQNNHLLGSQFKSKHFRLGTVDVFMQICIQAPQYLASRPDVPIHRSPHSGTGQGSASAHAGSCPRWGSGAKPAVPLRTLAPVHSLTRGLSCSSFLASSQAQRSKEPFSISNKFDNEVKSPLSQKT